MSNQDTDNYNEQLATLVSMGFDAVKAEQALKETNGDIYQAVAAVGLLTAADSHVALDGPAADDTEEHKKRHHSHKHSHKKSSRRHSGDHKHKKSSERHHSHKDRTRDGSHEHGKSPRQHSLKHGKSSKHDKSHGNDEMIAREGDVPLEKPKPDGEGYIIAPLVMDAPGTLPTKMATKPHQPDTDADIPLDGHSNGEHYSIVSGFMAATTTAPTEATGSSVPVIQEEYADSNASTDVHCNSHFREVFPEEYKGHDVEANGVDSLPAQRVEQVQDVERPSAAVSKSIDEPSGWWSKRRNRCIILGAVLLLVAAGIAAGIAVPLTRNADTEPINNQVGSGEVESTRPPTPDTISTPPPETTLAPSTIPAAFTTQPPQMTTPLPASTPTLDISPSDCYSSLGALDDVEQNVTDINVTRTYVLCANTTFYTGYVTGTGNIVSGDVPLTLRRNMHVYCGEVGGSSDNNCVITRGSFGLTSVPGNFEVDSFNNDVLIQGVTFDDAADFAAIIQLPGSFQFIDCIFSNHQSGMAPVYIEWLGGTVAGGARRDLTPPGYNYSPHAKKRHAMIQGKENRGLQVSTTLSVEFIDCVFKDCTCATDSMLAMIYLGGDGIDVKFTRTLFQKNDYAVPGVNDAVGYGILVENYGNGPLTLDSNCFIENKAIGNGLVASYGQALPSVMNNFGSNNDVVYTTDLECEFAALVQEINGTYPNIACADFDAITCDLI